MDRQSFVSNGLQKYNGARSSFSDWLSTAQGAYVLDWELAQFDSAVEDVFGFRAVQIGLPEVDFLRQNRIPFRFSLALEPGAALAVERRQRGGLERFLRRRRLRRCRRPGRRGLRGRLGLGLRRWRGRRRGLGLRRFGDRFRRCGGGVRARLLGDLRGAGLEQREHEQDAALSKAHQALFPVCDARASRIPAP